MMPSSLNFEYPEKLDPIVSQQARYKIARGDRGSAKSWTFAALSVERAYTEKIKILCVREIQKSIKESVHALIKDTIIRRGLKDAFRITQDAIYSATGAEYMFKGLRGNLASIRSTEGVDIMWAEEAEQNSADSWDILLPTIRKPRSEIWMSYNPETEDSPTHQYFVKKPRPDSLIIEVNYWDNPWFPDVLRREMEYDRDTDPEKWAHIWCGKFKKYAEDLVFRGKFVMEDFDTPEGVQFYFGLDFGFTVDPSCLNRMWIREVGHNHPAAPAPCREGCKRPHYWLMIDWEAYGWGVEIEELPAFLDSVPLSRNWEITADSARPDTISHLQRKGFNVNGAEKGAGSVEDGIELIRGFDRVVFNPRCNRSYNDWANYRLKRDKVTNQVLPIPIDLSNHSPDAVRYALEKYSKNKGTIWEVMRNRR